MPRLPDLSLLLKTPPALWPVLVREKLGLAGGLEAFDADHPCVFVLSTGRVGTQTLAALCDLSPRVIAVHEPRPSLYGLSRRAYELSGSADAAAVQGDALLAVRRDALNQALRRGRGYVETSPQVTFLAPAIARAVEGVRFVHLVRDPRDVVRSAIRRRWYDGNRADADRIRPRPGTHAASEWDSWSVLEKNAWLWTETNRWIEDFGATFDPSRWLTLRSEPLLEGDPGTVANLFQFLGDAPPDSKRIRKVLSRRMNAQLAGDFPTHDQWGRADRETLERVAGETASRYGYEF